MSKKSMKVYAVVIDVSPSEQISDDDNQIFSMGVLLGLKSPSSFDQVGINFPIDSKRLVLRKYAGSSTNYKTQVKEHLRYVKEADHVMASVNVVNQRYIKRMGLKVFEKAHGNLPATFDYNKKGKPRYRLGGYKKDDGTTVEPYTVLEDDLCIIGWISSELGLLHKEMCDINEEIVKLDVLMDRLPNDQGPDGTNKVELLKWTVGKLSDFTIHIAGIPDRSDYYQRDLLTDNISGICRELAESDPENGEMEIKSILRLTKFSIPEE